MPGDIDGSFPNWKIQTRGHPPVEEDGRFSNPFMKNPDGESQGRKHYDAPMSKSWAPRRLMKPGQPAKGKEDRPEGTRKVPQPDRSEVGESLHPNPNSRRITQQSPPGLAEKDCVVGSLPPGPTGSILYARSTLGIRVVPRGIGITVQRPRGRAGISSRRGERAPSDEPPSRVCVFILIDTREGGRLRAARLSWIKPTVTAAPSIYLL